MPNMRPPEDLNSNALLRRRLFLDGAAAVARKYPRYAGMDIGPLCNPPRGFTEAALLAPEILTIDHVPPEAAGHVLKVLLCKDCNSTAGQTVDKQLVQQETVLHFALGEEAPTFRSKFTLAGHSVNVDVKSETDGYQIRVLPDRWNKLGEPAAINSEFARLSSSTEKYGFGLRLPSFDPRAESIGWLRAAFLLAFAKVGYSYSLDDELAAVREQLSHPSEPILQSFSMRDSQVEPTNTDAVGN